MDTLKTISLLLMLTVELCLVLTSSLGISLWDSVVVQKQNGALNCCVQILLSPGLVQVAFWLQQPQSHVSDEHS